MKFLFSCLLLFLCVPQFSCQVGGPGCLRITVNSLQAFAELWVENGVMLDSGVFDENSIWCLQPGKYQLMSDADVEVFLLVPVPNRLVPTRLRLEVIKVVDLFEFEVPAECEAMGYCPVETFNSPFAQGCAVDEFFEYLNEKYPGQCILLDTCSVLRCDIVDFDEEDQKKIDMCSDGMMAPMEPMPAMMEPMEPMDPEPAMMEPEPAMMEPMEPLP